MCILSCNKFSENLLMFFLFAHIMKYGNIDSKLIICQDIYQKPWKSDPLSLKQAFSALQSPNGKKLCKFNSTSIFKILIQFFLEKIVLKNVWVSEKGYSLPKSVPPCSIKILEKLRFLEVLWKKILKIHLFFDFKNYGIKIFGKVYSFKNK